MAALALALAPLSAGSPAHAATTAHAAQTTAAAAQSAASPATPELWPKLKPFKTLTVVTLNDGTDQQLLAATTLEGAYNQRAGRNRLYVVWNGDDQTWLNQNAFRGSTWSAIQSPSTSATDELDAALADYGHDIKGAIIVNPSDTDTTNLATTMAGIDDAMVAYPDQVALLQQYGIPVLYSFADTTFASQTAAYQWEYTNLFPETNPKDLVLLNPGDYGQLRDYIIATKSFVFYLTSTSTAEEPLMNQIISSRPTDTPILGYIADEGPDVADLSSLGDFLNASDLMENESDFAAVPSLPGLVQPKPKPVRTASNTVYVGYVVSDGDNAQYVEHHMFDVWTGDSSYLGTVPEGWTVPPGLSDYGPSMLSWYNQHLPRDSELIAGPSGAGYATQMTGTDLQQFATLSGGFMRKDSISTVDFWENPSELAAYAKASGVPSISVDGPLAYTQEGKTAVIGQTSSYVDPASALLTTIEQDALAEETSQPVFLEPLVDGWTLGPQDVLAISQALATWGKSVGKNFVFLTPSELALTDEAYHQGTGSRLPRLNAEAVSGASLLNLPPAGTLTGYTPPASVSGPNLVANPSGAQGTDGWTDTAGTVSSGTYDGNPDLTWSVPADPSTNSLDPSTSQQWVHVYPAVTNGDTYQVSVQVAGSGQVFMDVYSGTTDNQSPAINLTSSYQTLTWTVTIPSNAPTGQTGNAPQLQVREIGIGAVDVHIQDATVQLASSASPATIPIPTPASAASQSSSTSSPAS